MTDNPAAFAVEPPTTGRSPRQTEVFERLLDLTLERGFANYTLEQAAFMLRCSKSTIYALAGTREQLIRAVVVAFFRRAAERVEQRVAAEPDPAGRIEVYLLAVASELRPASAEFMDDVASLASTREIYELNTAIAAQRVHELIVDGIETGAFRDVPTAFIAEVASSVMVRIQQRAVARNTGMSDAEAYAELASLIVHGIIRAE